MKRQHVDLQQLASWDNLTLALWKAARGKRQRPDVIQFLSNYELHLTELRERILNQQLPLANYHCFQIKDPKPRKITAVSFDLRLVHHAIMNLIGQNFERTQIDNSFACLPERGAHAAVQRVQQGLRRGHWCVKIDIEKYFECIDHTLLKEKLARRFKGQQFMQLLDAIIDSYAEQPGKGLPIGSLTSQYFANFYLEGADRVIERMPETKGYVRYMDDMIWFCQDKSGAQQSLARTVQLLEGEKLQVKPQRWVQPVGLGVHYCGYRIMPHRIHLSRRKKRAYKQHLERWQDRWQAEEIDSLELQRGYDAVHGMTTLADSQGFRRSVLARLADLDA
jgi:hypothetical protein